MSTQADCPCDVCVHPAPLDIGAGLTTIPRQIASFPRFRHAMLSELPTKAALAGWRARGDEDLGVMLIEMWAYVCDVVSFYDETIAHESYLRTARLSPSVRKLVGLLGYRPRPAVSARARLALLAEGRLRVAVPAGAAFRSGAFGAEPPQVFELDQDSSVHPLLNRWALAPTRPVTNPSGSVQLFERGTARVKVGDHLLVLDNGIPVADAATVMGVEKTTGADGNSYVKVTLDQSWAPMQLATARVLRSTANTTLWNNPADTTPSIAIHKLTLSGVVPNLGDGDCFISRGPTGLRAHATTAVTTTSRIIVPAVAATTTLPGRPAVYAPVTQIHYASDIPSSWTDPTRVFIEYALEDAGKLTDALNARIQPGDPLQLEPPVEAPPDGSQPSQFLIDDADGTSAEVTGGVNFAARTLTPATGSDPTPALDPPATAYGNVVSVSRGETVRSETLGVGDASIANQSFTLKKKPLTYLATPTGADPNGIANTLTIWVRDIQWTEVPTFFGVGPDEAVYFVRQNDDGDSIVTTGDGVSGLRLPTGAVVVARYRYGAGAASPPAGGIVQLAKPVKGITAVRNPLAASGGADAQPASQVRVVAPRSSLLFGRAVSIKDMEALVAGQPGVQAVQALWAWDASLQRPAVQLWYIGPAGIASSVAAALRNATAPGTPVVSTRAQSVSAWLGLSIRVDGRFVTDRVKARVDAALTAPGTGLLSAERIGIGTPLFRSQIVAAALEVEGVTSVESIRWQGATLNDYGVAGVPGTWFNVSVIIDATEDPNG